MGALAELREESEEMVRVLIVDDQEPFRLAARMVVEATRQILNGSNRVVILLLSTYEEEEYGPRAAECGAAAYIPKSSFVPERLSEAWQAAQQNV